MKKIILSLCVVIIGIFNAKSQDLIKAEFLGNLNQATFSVIINTFIPDIEVPNGVDLYKINYTTTGSDMMLDTASGLLIVPDLLDGPKPILNYQHGTTSGRSQVPSNLAGQEYLLAGAFGALGFITIAPDYVGMGDSRGFHPYVNSETEASAMIDMLSATKEYLDENEIAYTQQLFITGYSQGGHGAMAAQRKIEETLSQDLAVTASLPMSGPYSISGVMLELAFIDEEFFFPSYLVYTILGMKAIDDSTYDQLSDIFRTEFISVISQFATTGEGLFEMNAQLLDILERDFGGSFPKFLFNDSFREEIMMNPDHPFIQHLKNNDLFDWKPTAPTLMLYCKSDDNVPFMNSIVADSVMNELGAENVSAMDVAGGQNLSHTDCIAPALQVGVPWLLSFVDNTVSTTEISYNSGELSIYPNPTHNTVNIKSKIDGINLIEVYNLNGQRIISNNSTQSSYAKLDVSNFRRGIYIVKVWTNDKVLTEKIVIQ